jgi:CheY-like chemotaxis protein
MTGVIVADDDPMIRSVLRSRLEALGVTVFVAADGLEAVTLASRMHAALIMLDLNMPRLNGLLACQRIRKLPGNAQTPIVVLTSTVGKDAETAAARVGATTYLTKPFSSAPLLLILSRFLPIEDAKRQEIRRDADLASRIAGTAPAPNGDRSTTSAGRSSLLQRDKSILGVLRG